MGSSLGTWLGLNSSWSPLECSKSAPVVPRGLIPKAVSKESNFNAVFFNLVFFDQVFFFSTAVGSFIARNWHHSFPASSALVITGLFLPLPSLVLLLRVKGLILY